MNLLNIEWMTGGIREEAYDIQNRCHARFGPACID